MALNTTRGTERTLGQLVSDATTDLQNIVKGEIDLAKVEIKADAQKAGKGGGMLAAAGVFALFMLGFLLTSLAYGLSNIFGWNPWAGFLIVAGILAVVAAVLALIGIKALKKIKGKPEKTIENAQATVAAIKPAK
ncbi:phage holin family protein [Dermacoccus nishinomiyaensis]|uniref:phage holin family protein n=1 Tax=Dermacoccus nishinomiyaensis TaxID=1274 RepID=UPI00119DFCD9|nr:phage holin family protein [Dermacoccus nishinomiyaensis]MCG7428817.1 phage holin family protein [Dermacoccus nishinomiyaensis]NHC31137.1 phage holin family protein [Dermacoccus nishinomiyaensis]